jgi:hypothetical protein
MTNRMLHVGAVLALGAAVGCSDTGNLGPGDGMGDVTVNLQRTEVLSASVVAAALEGEITAAPEGKVPMDQVQSLTITITSIEMLRDCEADEGAGDGTQSDGECAENGGWIPLELDEPVTIDFMALPVPDDSVVVLASGSLPVGDYRNIRLFVRDEFVVFTADITVGNVVFKMGIDHPVVIPSGDKTGIKTDLSFTVTEDDEGNEEEVNLLFDTEATFRGVTATGSGKVMLPPVLKAKPKEAA